jgi:hypothetical protein
MNKNAHLGIFVVASSHEVKEDRDLTKFKIHT